MADREQSSRAKSKKKNYKNSFRNARRKNINWFRSFVNMSVHELLQWQINNNESEERGKNIFNIFVGLKTLNFWNISLPN